MVSELDVFDRGKFSIEDIFADNLKIRESSLNDKNEIEGELSINNIPFQYNIIIKPTVPKINEFLNRDHSSKDTSKIIVFPTAKKEITEYCRVKGINYMDAAGNALINHPRLKVYIEGRKPFEKKQSRSRLFQKTGMKLIYHLLSYPHLLNAPYRTIATHAKVSSASVGNIFEELKEEGFMLETDSYGRKLLNVRHLITRWAYNYSDVLKPKLHRGYFMNMGGNLEEIIMANGKNEGVLLSGEHGAYYLRNYLKPINYTIYADMRLSDMARKYQIAPINKIQEGQPFIEVVAPFWNQSYGNTEYINYDVPFLYNRPIVNPIIIFSDLLESKNSRNIEEAFNILNHDIRHSLEGPDVQW